jgi:hypothetical protein
MRIALHEGVPTVVQQECVGQINIVAARRWCLTGKTKDKKFPRKGEEFLLHWLRVSPSFCPEGRESKNHSNMVCSLFCVNLRGNSKPY